MSIIFKCKNCNGKGYVPMGHGIRGLAVCKVCNGVGTYENDEIISDEMIIINDIPFYRIPNGTNYKYTPIPKEFKPYFEMLQQEKQQLKEVIEKAREYINNYDVFKEFSFPLMKREVENQIKSSMKYEFDTSIKKHLLQIFDKAKEVKYGKSNENIK